MDVEARKCGILTQDVMDSKVQPRRTGADDELPAVDIRSVEVKISDALQAEFSKPQCTSKTVIQFLEVCDDEAKIDEAADPVVLSYPTTQEQWNNEHKHPQNIVALPTNTPISPLQMAQHRIAPVLQRPTQILSHLRPVHPSINMMDKVQSFHKKALKANAIKVTEQSHLRLGQLTTAEISILYMAIQILIVVIPIIQILYGVMKDDVSSTNGHEVDRQNDLGDVGFATDASVQAIGLLFSTLFIHRIIRYTNRQRIQTELLLLACFWWVIYALALAANLLNGCDPSDNRSRYIMMIANTLLSGLLYLVLIHFSDFYSKVVTKSASPNSIMHQKQRGRYDWVRAFVTSDGHSTWWMYGFVVSCMGLRIALSWRNSVIFDFLPMTNFVTPVRVQMEHHFEIDQQHLFVDAIVLSVVDAVLLLFAYYKSKCAYASFQHVFVQDFARVFTEFSIFVLYFRETLLLITVAGQISAWTVPFSNLFERMDVQSDTTDKNSSVIHIVQLGSSQDQVGYIASLLIWMIMVLYCALPADSIGVKGWLVGSTSIKPMNHQRIKYFLFESDVHMKATFRNLALIDWIDPTHFIMEKQIESFNLAQLVYRCGNKHERTGSISQECARIQALVGDPKFTVVDVIECMTTDTHCLVLSSPSLIAIAFRGTSSKKNARTDLQAAMTLHRLAAQLDLSTLPSLSFRLTGQPPEKAKHGYEGNTVGGKNNHLSGTSQRSLLHRLACKRNPPKVHSGFNTAYSSVEQRVLAKVKKLHDEDPRRILVTGHSLGGALAVLCSFDIVVRLRLLNVTCTTFGCPRIGNTAFRKKYMHAVPATFAFVNAADLITKLPPKTPKALSYTSVGTTVLINSFGNLVINPNILEMAVLHQGLSAKAHSLKSYQLALLLWCLRSHKLQYRPHFWRHPTQFLEEKFSHLSEVREYLKATRLGISCVASPTIVGDLSLSQVRTPAEQYEES